MKNLNLILAVLMALVMQITTAQTNIYHPFPTSNATWRVDFWTGALVTTNSLCFSCYKCQYQISGDTIIGGCNYHKILKTGSDYYYDGNLGCNYNMPTCIDNQYMGALREDTSTHKVYFINGSITDTILYDFTLNVGNTLPVGFNNHCFNNDTISSIDSVLIGTQYRKRWNFNTGGCGMPASIIEGIGSTHGLLEELYSFEEGGDLICFSQNDTTYYPTYNTSGNCTLITVGINEVSNNSSSLSFLPNPASTAITFRQNSQLLILNSQLLITNVLGQEIYKQTLSGIETIIDISKWENGVYFVQVRTGDEIINRKFVVNK